MRNYKIELIPNIADDGKEYWTAKFPSVPGCRGGGDTLSEAIDEAYENLDVYLEFLAEEGHPIPSEDSATHEYSGKIALRMAKSTHRKVAENATKEGVSINSYIVGTLERRIGAEEIENKLEKNVLATKNIATESFLLQQASVKSNAELWNIVNQSYLLIGDKT